MDGTRCPCVSLPEGLTAPVQAVIKGIVITPPEVPSTTYINYTIDDAPVAALNSEYCTDKNRRAFLAHIQVNGLQMNLLVEIG